MPFLSASRAEPAVPTLGNPLEEEEEPVPPPGPEGQPEGSSGPPSPSLPEVGQAEEVRVFVYTTHNAESYVPDYGVAKVAPGSAGGVTRVAAVLAAALEEQGVRTVLSTAVHDYPDFRWSYVKAESTVKAALARYPRLSLIVDVHRDAGQNRPVTAAVEGQTVAQILLVVGSDRRLAHPNWQENLAFAKKVEAKMNELFPGLCAGTRVQDGRYNQHLHPRAILVEVGNHLNTLAEAEASARLLARVLKEVL
jgi:stage II sporulation protein P